MPVKKKIVKPVKPAAKAATPVPKMKLRTTAAAKVKKATAVAASNGTRLPCLCNCGELSTNFLLRGHWKKVKGYLAAVKAGDAKPEKLFGAKIARAMGPWSPTRGGGQIPKTTDYARIRANLSA